jgi:hypothetical protein
MIFVLQKCVYNCALIKVDWLAACIALSGTVFVIVLRRWRTIFTVSSHWEARADI